MDRPTADQVRSVSELLTTTYPDGGPNEAVFEARIEEAAALASILTARNIGLGEAPGDTPYGCPFEDVPVWAVPLALRAVALGVESLQLGTTAKARRTAFSSTKLKSFSAGPYSESYFGPEEAAKAHVLSPDALTNAALMAILTDCARMYWLRVWGELEPEGAGMAHEFDYRMRPGGY